MDKDRFLIRNSADLLAQLRDKHQGVTFALMVLTADQKAGVVLATFPSFDALTFSPNEGAKGPLHVCAPTKAILAAMPEPERRNIINRITLKKYTERSHTEKEPFLEELRCDAIRKFSVDYSEHNPGINCVSSAVFDEGRRPVAALFATALASRLSEEQCKTLAPEIIAVAATVSQRIGRGVLGSERYAASIIRQAEKYLATHIAEPLSMEEVAKRLHVGYSWFRMEFKKRVGVSPNRYWLALRMERAKELLRETDFPVSAIAIQLGYDSQHYFSAQFKKQTSLSPSRFRTKFRKQK